MGENYLDVKRFIFTSRYFAVDAATVYVPWISDGGKLDGQGSAG
jgi:hypothetical protein